jgi:hypothetical protein
MFLKNFEVIRPNFETDQKTLLEWIISAHVESKKQSDAGEESLAFAEEIREKIFKLGFGENKIQKRGFHLEDCTHQNWNTMSIYNMETSPEGQHLTHRMEFFDRSASEIFEKYYPESVYQCIRTPPISCIRNLDRFI